MLFCGAKHRHKHSLFLCWPFPSCWGRAGIDTDKILKITRTSGAFDCNQCKLAHNSYICLPKILKWRIMDVVIFLGCEKTVSRVRRSFHIFVKKAVTPIRRPSHRVWQKYLWSGVCHIHWTEVSPLGVCDILMTNTCDVVIFWVVKKLYLRKGRRPFTFF